MKKIARAITSTFNLFEQLEHFLLGTSLYFSVCKYLKKDGFQFVPGGCLILDFNLNKNEVDSIGMINKIFVVDGNYVFYVQLYSIRKFHENLNCLEIDSELKYKYVYYENLYFIQIQFCKKF